MSESSDFRVIRPVDIPTSGGSFSRASLKWVFDRTGTLVEVPAGALAVTYDPADLGAAPRPLIEAAATNHLRNSTMVGAASGSPGTQPTHWFGWTTTQNGISSSIEGSGQEGGIDFIDVRFQGTAAVTGTLWTGSFAPSGVVSASVAESWALSCFCRLMSGAIGRSRPSLRLAEYPASGVALATLTSAEFTPTADPLRNQRQGAVFTLSQAATASIAAMFRIAGTAGDFYDFTLRIGLPQLERDQVTSPIKTSGAAATRAADVFSTAPGIAYCNVPITEPVYNPATTYAQYAVVLDPATGETYQSLVAGNVGQALTDATKWLSLGKTNRLIAFDKAVNSQTKTPDMLVYAIVPGALVSDVMLLNIAGARVTVEQPATGYRKTVNLVSHPVTNWYEFFAEEPLWVGDAYFENLAPHAAGVIVVIVEAPGSDAGLGCCFLGKSKVIGTTQNGLDGGVISYSSTKTDAQGNMRMVRRANARRMTCSVQVERGMEDAVYRLLSECTDVELAVVASTAHTMTYQYGYLGQWSVPIAIDGTPARIEFKGLI